MSNGAQTGGLLAGLSNELADAVQRASQSVVTVDARRQVAASGILWPAGAGIVVTADHVVERDEDITVRLADGRNVAATIAGRDPGTDIAVLRLAASADGSAPAPVELAAIESVKIGNVVLAIGRPGDGATMATFGIVSALGGKWRTARGGTVEGYVRADVALYPGFSGGPLVDTQGRVIGLNSWHLAGGQELAIPAAAVGTIVQTLVTQGRIRRAYLGVTSQPVALPDALQQKLGLSQRTGLVVVGVEPGSPADKSGLLLGDIVVSFAGQAIADPRDLQTALGTATVDTATNATIIRGGERKELSVTPGERA
jgi:S1-C subfamily serine protease